MIQTIVKACGDVTYDTRETFYHVYVPEKGWIGEVGAVGWTALQVLTYTHEQPYAQIFSRRSALNVARELNAHAYMVTRTGKMVRLHGNQR